MSAALTTNVDQRLLRTTKFPPEFNTKVDLQKVNIDLIKSWVGDEIAKILKSEDDVVTELVCNILSESRYPNIKELQISLAGFLDKDAAPFCKTLWNLCLSAQQSPHGIPKELLEAKKAELAQAKAEEDKAREEATKRQEADRTRERELDRTRDRERSDRGRGRGRGGRGGRDFDRRPPRGSRSPPPRRGRDDDGYRRPVPRGGDSYVPGNGRYDERPSRRRRSPSYGRSSSRSRSPPPRRRRRDDSPSRSPPRKRRKSSSERSISRDRGQNRSSKFGRARSRSPPRRRRSPSPRRHYRRSQDDRSRSPPPKRNSRASPTRPSTSDSRSSALSQTSQGHRKNGPALGAEDLMSTNGRKEGSQLESGRLSREPTSASVSNSEIPLTDDRNETPSLVPSLLVQQRQLANQLREKELKLQLLARKDFRRKDSMLGNPPK